MGYNCFPASSKFLNFGFLRDEKGSFKQEFTVDSLVSPCRLQQSIMNLFQNIPLGIQTLHSEWKVALAPEKKKKKKEYMAASKRLFRFSNVNENMFY